RAPPMSWHSRAASRTVSNRASGSGSRPSPCSGARGSSKTLVRRLLASHAMAASTSRTEELRRHVTSAIQHSTDLIADLQALAGALGGLGPELRAAPASERWAEVSRIAALAAALPDTLAAVVETLADVLAGLTSSDGGQGWLEHQRARLDAGEDVTAA